MEKRREEKEKKKRTRWRRGELRFTLKVDFS